MEAKRTNKSNKTNKTNKTSRLMALLLTVCLLMGLVPVTALAADITYNLWVGGIRVTSANADDVLGDADEGATVTYDASTSTLTLNNANITGTYQEPGKPYKYVILFNTSNLNLKLIGANKITPETDGYGIYSKEGTLTVDGSGTLEIKTNNHCIAGKRMVMNGGSVTASGEYNYAIISLEGLTVNDGSITARNDGRFGWGIRAYDLTVTGGSVTGETTNQRGDAINAPYLTVSGGTVTGKATGTARFGILTGGMTVSGEGTVIGEGYTGIIANYGDITVSGGTVTGRGNAEDAIGIAVEGTLTVDDGEVSGVNTANGGAGIQAWKIVSNGGTISGEGTRMGISNQQEGMTVTGGTVTGKSIGENAYGIITKDLVVDGGEVIGNSTGDGIGVFEYGLRAASMTVNGGTVTGTTPSETGEGIYVKDTLTLNGGEVIGTATHEQSAYGILAGGLKVTNDTSKLTGKGARAAIAAYAEYDTQDEASAAAQLQFPNDYLALDSYKIYQTTGSYQAEDSSGEKFYGVATIAPKDGTPAFNAGEGTFTDAVKEITLPAEAAPQPTEYKVRVCGTQVTSANKDDVLGDKDGDKATVRYNPDTNTVTLDNAKLTTYSEGVYTWGSGPDFTVELIGENTIGPEQGTPYCGIASRSNLKITGSGSLTTTGLPVGIDTRDVDLFFGGGTTIYDITIENGVKLILDCVATEDYDTPLAMTVKPTLPEGVTVKSGDSAANATEVTDPANTDYHTNKYVSIVTAGHAETEIKKGDVNGDGKVDLLDLRMVLRYICKKTDLNERELQAANMVGEEDKVDLLDLRQLLRVICGKA